jgi:hypothetical protein
MPKHYSIPCGANLLHCHSPCYLCLEHVDNVRLYSFPSETGLPIHLIATVIYRLAKHIRREDILRFLNMCLKEANWTLDLWC